MRLKKADSIDPFSQQITPADIIHYISKLIMQYTTSFEDYYLPTVCTDWPPSAPQESDLLDTDIVLNNMVNWHASDFFPKEEKTIRALLLSGKDFSVEGNAAKTDLYVNISAHKEDIRCCVTIGSDNAENMIDAAMQEINGRNMYDLSDAQLHKILDSICSCGIHTEVVTAVTIPRTSTFEQVQQALAEEEIMAKQIWSQQVRKTKHIVQSELDEENETDEDPRFNSILRDFGYSEAEIDELRELRREIAKKTKQSESEVFIDMIMN